MEKQNWGEIHLRSYSQNEKREGPSCHNCRKEEDVQHYLGRQVIGEDEEET